jgi:hypothetical protein
MRIEEFRSDPDRIKAYREWLSLPMTQTVMALVRERIADAFLYGGLPNTTEAGAQLHALTFGRQEIVDFLTRELASDPVAVEDLQPNYGADDRLLREYGYIKTQEKK